MGCKYHNCLDTEISKYVSTVGKDEETTRNYIKNQEKEDRHLDQIELFPEEDKPSSDGE